MNLSMNLFSLIPYLKTKIQIEKPLKVKKTLKIVKFFSICSLMLLTSQTVQAFDLNVNTTNVNDISKTQSNNWTYQDLVNGNLLKQLPTLLPFKRRDAEYIATVIKDQYLTFYSNKNEKLKATYASSAYYLKYTHRW